MSDNGVGPRRPGGVDDVAFSDNRTDEAVPASNSPGRHRASIVKPVASALSASAAAGFASLAVNPGVVSAALTVIQALVQEVLSPAMTRGLVRVAEECGFADVPFDEAAETLAAEPDGTELLLRTLDAARFTASEEKLRALGQSLAAAASDTARIDTELLLVDAIHDVQPAHLRLLRLFELRPPSMGLVPGVLDELIEGESPWTLSQLEGVDGAMDWQTATVLIGTLARHGLVRSVSNPPLNGAGGGAIQRWAITGQGQLLLARAAAADEDGQAIESEG